MDGQRLNPRKIDLQRWRERFVHELRELGVEAEETRRAARMHQQRINKPWPVTRIEERGGVPIPLLMRSIQSGEEMEINGSESSQLVQQDY